MSRNTEPIFIGDPRTVVATVGDETVVRNPTNVSTMQKLLDAGSNGALIESITAVPLGNNAQTVLRIFLVPENSPPSLILEEVTLPLINTASETAALPIQTVQLPKIIVGDVGSRALRLPPGSSLYCGLSQTVATGWNIVAMGGLY